MTEVAFRVGDLIENRYRVLAVVGAGGMGTLYRVADETRDDEVIALKTVRLDAPAAEASESVARFQREFQILTQLRHPNLVSVYDYGITTEGQLYFTMEWIQGQDLEPDKHPLTPTAIVPTIVQVCRALAYLHARGVIHGDLKPSNILMTDDQVKIVDFGVALEVRTPEVRARYYTPGYAAPEVRQLRAVDHRADLYSLGAVWYALLMGESPPSPQRVFGYERLMRLTLDELLEAQETIPLAVSGVVARLLAVSPEDRYASANEVIAAVNEVTGSTYSLETRETAASYALRVHFVNRETEIEVLQTTWQQAQAGEGKLVFVSGESGVGKTRLVEELVVQAELEGARVARGQCVESGSSAYRPWREVLRVLVRYVEAATAGANEGIMPQVGPVLATLLPELWQRSYMADLAPPAELESQAAQQRLNDAIVRVLRAAAGLRPTVVVIEDAHWADEATLALLQFLARVPGQAGLLVCVTYRDDAVGPRHLLETLGDGRVQRIQVRSLSPEVTTDLVRSMLGLEKLPALLTERVQQTTGGNAFFVQELIRSLAEDGAVLQRTVDGWQVDRAALRTARLPESIRQVVWQRLEHLSEEAQRMLRWAAVVGPVFWDGAVAQIGRVSQAQVRTALREGVEQELILARDTSAFAGEQEYMFVSPTVQEVSYDTVSRPERWEYHSRVAVWLLARSEEEVGEHLGLVAEHLEGAGQVEQAVAYLTRAGEQATAQFANAEAVAYFSRALDLTPAEEQGQRYELLLAREGLYHLQGAREMQARDLAMLQDLAMALGDSHRQAEVALRQAAYAEATGDYPAAIAAARKAIDLARAAQDMNQEAMGYMQCGYALWRQGDFEAAKTQLEQALTLARTAGDRKVETDSLRNLGVISSIHGDFAAAGLSFEWILRIYREVGNRQGEGVVLNYLGIVSFKQGNYAAGRTYYEQSLGICREIGDRAGEGRVVSNLGLLCHYLGDNEAAQEYSKQALRIARDVGNRTEQGFALTSLGHALTSLGHPAEAADAYRQALEIRRELGDPHAVMESLAGLARVSLARGDQTQALTYVEEILSHLKDHDVAGIYEPFRVHLTCYRVLRANQDPRAGSVLSAAYHLLQDRAARITDEELQRSFLESVTAHREIVDEWQTLSGEVHDRAGAT